MGGFRRSLLFVLAFFAAFCAAPLAWAADLPANLCTLLSQADVSKVIGKSYSAPQPGSAPRPYPNTNSGTDCRYLPNGPGEQLLFRIYVDNSPPQSADLHAQLKIFYSPATPVGGVGDEAYFDPKHAIHVRKGKVRYYLNLGDEPSAEKPVKELATLVAGRF